MPISPQNLRISYKTHLVMPYHKQEDAAREASRRRRGASAPPRRGIGPTYADKMQRATAIRVADLMHEEKLKAAHRPDRHRAEQGARRCCTMRRRWSGSRSSSSTATSAGGCSRYVDDVGPPAARATARRASASSSKARTPSCWTSITARIPYVTSSSCSALGLFTGAGVPPQTVQNFVGIMKAYSTRVGGGPFPTEQDNDIGNYIRERGNEYGTTTRRPRRCGWFDADGRPILRRPVRHHRRSP